MIGREPFYHEIIREKKQLHEVKTLRPLAHSDFDIDREVIFSPFCSQIRHGRLRLSLDEINSKKTSSCATTI